MRRNHKCPLCMWVIKIAHHDEPGDLILCKGCRAEYELRSLHPIRLRPLNFFNGLDEYEDVEYESEMDTDVYHSFLKGSVRNVPFSTMFQQRGVSVKKRASKRSVIHQFRSCEFCRSVDGLEISSFQEEGDTISCQVCGVQYRIQSLSPLRLYPVNSQTFQEQQDEKISENQYFS